MSHLARNFSELPATSCTLAVPLIATAFALYSVPLAARQIVGVFSTFLYRWLSDPFIEAEAKRAGMIIRDLLNFARR